MARLRRHSPAERSRQIGQLAEAASLLADAAKVAVSEGDGPALAAAALGIGGLWVYEQRDFLERARLHQLWQQARAVAPGSIAAARLDVRITAEAVYDGGPVEAVQVAVDALAPVGDDRVLAEAYSLLHNVQLGPAFAASPSGAAEMWCGTPPGARTSSRALMGLCSADGRSVPCSPDPRADRVGARAAESAPSSRPAQGDRLHR